MILQPIVGASYFLRGFKLINQRGIRKFVAIPLLINTVLFAALIIFGFQQFNEFLDWLLPGWLEWLWWLLVPLFTIALLLVVFFTFTLIANVIGAPFNALLAEALEEHLTGRKLEDSGGWGKMFKELIPTVWAELKKLLYFILWSIPFLVLFLIPVINLLAPVLWILFTAWMLSLEYLDYPMGNHGISFDEMRARLHERRTLSLGFGAATMVATSIPIVNFFVMPTAVAGATALWVERLKEAPSEKTPIAPG